MRNPFKKREGNQTIAELENYYSSYNTGNGSGASSRAWIMAFLSLIITLAVIAALFFGIRWIYNALTDDDDVLVGTTSQDDGSPLEIVGGENETNIPSGPVVNGDNDPRRSDDAVVGILNPSDDDDEGVVSDEAASTTRDVAGSSTDRRDETNLGGNNTGSATIPDTGASELIIAIPALTIALGYAISRKNQLR